MTEDFAGLFAAIRREELAALKELPWQNEPLPGESVSATFSNETGLTSLNGAIPFLETEKSPLPTGENRVHMKSEELAQFLAQHRALFRSYRKAAETEHYRTVGDVTPSHITHVTSDIPGMEAANLAIFIAAQISQGGSKTLLIDADPQNQFVFPLITFPEPPKLLTEQLQKPSTFKADLTKAIVPLNRNLSYLNLQASSLRPFDDAEMTRLCGFLDADFENLVFYCGRFRSAWLSSNAHLNYAVCPASYKSELAALLRHAQGSHTVLMKKGREPYLPLLSDFFSVKRPLEEWQQNIPMVAALAEFVLKTHRANRLVIGGRENLAGNLHCYTGFELFARYAGLADADAERALNALQKRLRPYYPKASFFGERSILNRVKSLPNRAATTILEVGDEPQIVSLISSPELKAAAIFPAGIMKAISTNGVRISACSAHGFVRFQTLAARGGFTSVLTAPRYRLAKPNALAAVMEQVQA
jgi:hypothetical protein